VAHQPKLTAWGWGDPTTPEHLSAALEGRYALERELGRGGTALVYLVRDLQHDRLVTLKVIRPELGSVVRAKRFRREIQLAAKLQHPNILPIFDSGHAGGLLYCVMPYVEGESLRVRLRREGPLPLDEALQITREVASALGYAHRRGIVHQGIKPANILLSGGRALVLDFGIARAVAGGPGTPSFERLAETGLAVGSPAYMSPEQASGSRRVDRRTDIYSLGCVLYEMLGGESPYTGPTPQAVIAKRLHEPVPQVRALREGLPATVEQAVARALAKAPADRFATAEEFAAALAAEVLCAATSGLEPIAPRRPRFAIVGSRSRWVLAAAGFVALVAAAAALVLRHSAATRTALPVLGLGDRRVVVAVFTNQTGDSSLAPLGDIVADYLARGLAETRVVEVLDARATQSADSAAHTGGLAGARALAHALGAGSVLWGSFAKRGESLEFRAQLTDAGTGKPVAAILPAVGSAAQPTQGVELLRQHVMSALAARLDPRLERFADSNVSHAGTYDAYREVMTADTIGARASFCESACVSAAIVHYRRAYALDSNFTFPALEIARLSAFGGACDRTDSIAEALYPRHDRLPPLERLWLDGLVADCHGEREKAREMFRQALTVAPRSDELLLGYAFHARLAGHLREVIAVTEKVNPPAQGPGQEVYWDNLVYSYHLLGEHRRELEVAQRARRDQPDNLHILALNAGALVGLGHLAEVNTVVEEMGRMPREVGRQGGLSAYWLDVVGRELRTHGYRKEAQALFERGVRWIEMRPAAEQPDLRGDLAALLYDADRWEDASQILKQLTAQTPDDIDLQAKLGAIAAHRSDRREVARIDDWLGHRTGRYLLGEHTFHRARLAAILGDRDRAAQLYRQALDQGYGYYVRGGGTHADPDFESVRDYPPFQELTRPKD
jgi:tetratricopeptide (TPR) repeat protein/TolB-like protein